MVSVIRAVLTDDSGQDLVEYVLILVLVSLAAVSGMRALGEALQQEILNAAQIIGEHS